MDEACVEEEITNLKFKIILLGDLSVGKSAICTQLCKSFFVQSYRETYGCDFYSKVIYKKKKYTFKRFLRTTTCPEENSLTFKFGT